MITQQFLDVVVPAVKDKLKAAGLIPADIPVEFDDFRLTMYGAAGMTEFSKDDISRPTRMTLKRNQMAGAYWTDKMVVDYGVFGADEAIFAAAVLTHEFIHTALPWGASHGPVFAEQHSKLGLIVDPEKSIPGQDFVTWFDENVRPKLPKTAISKTMPFETGSLAAAAALLDSAT